MTTRELERYLKKLPNLPVFVVFNDQGNAHEVTTIGRINSDGKELAAPIKTYSMSRTPKKMIVLYGELQ